MFFIIGIWGSRNRRVRATFLLFIYTMAGSIMLLAATLIIYSDVGTTNFSLRKPSLVVIHHTAQKSCDQTLRTFTLARRWWCLGARLR